MQEEQGMSHISWSPKDAIDWQRENTLLIFKTSQLQTCENEKKKKKNVLQNGSFSEFKGCPNIDPLLVPEQRPLENLNNCIWLIIPSQIWQRI